MIWAAFSAFRSQSFFAKALKKEKKKDFRSSRAAPFNNGKRESIVEKYTVIKLYLIIKTLSFSLRN